MKVTATKGPRSSVVLEVEIPPERVARSIEQAVSRLSRTTRVEGFRPGRAPRAVLERVIGPERVLEEALEHLIPDTLAEALTEAEVVPLMTPDVEVVQRDEGKPVVYRATVPVLPEVRLGDYRDYPFGLEIEAVDDARVDQVVEELRDQQATLVPADGRPVRDGDHVVIAFEGRHEGRAFEGGSAERFPLVVGAGRMVPGFEEQLVGMAVGDERRFALDFPGDHPDTTLAGRPVEFTVTVREIREKALPPLDDELARSLGDFADLQALRAELRTRLEATARDRARHRFIDRIIGHAVDNATLEMPEALVNAEVDTMMDELGGRLAREGITLEQYLAAVFPEDQPPGGLVLPDSARRQVTSADRLARLRAEYLPRAEQRARVLLVLDAVAGAEELEISDEELEAELGRIRERHPDDTRLVSYFESQRGRRALRASLRRSAVVERLVEEWLAAHPEVGTVPHLEEGEPVTAADTAPAVEP